MPNDRITHPTLAAVARRAGVSVPTVSKVLRARPGVSAETRERVGTVLDQLGYPRGATGGHQSSLLGAALVDVVVTEIGTGWASRWLTALDEACRPHALSMVVTSLVGRAHRLYPEQQWLAQLARRGTTGVIGVMTEFTTTQLDYFRANGLPCVVIDAHQQPTGVVGLRVSNYEAERRATQHLIDLGHTKIALILGLATSIESDQRHAGYRHALEEAQLAYDPLLVGHGNFTGSGGLQATAALINSGVEFTAIVYASDRMAVAGMGLLAHQGYHIPDDVSVIGFDGTIECELASPPLTTLSQPVEAMARAAVSHLTESPEDAPGTIELMGELLIRSSTAPPPPAPVQPTTGRTS
ncbi:LacI family DNA-binding transcriptional regulator [Kribbella sp. CA-245084]|uniref:LacI family DNA-binding transcriptional regulator n=1 Tax=Kribbella sp. CA-245084 TaxID=3239940 RepID=UPI003D8F7FF3